MRAFLVLIVCLPLLADEESLVQRARTRIAHRNPEGARWLLEQAVDLDPHDGEALLLLASVAGEREAELRLRYLLEARTLAPEPTADSLRKLRGRVLDLPEEVYEALERAVLQEAAGVEACGPWLAPADAYVPPSAVPACGPTRAEAGCSGAHAHREALRRVAERFIDEGIHWPGAWAELAVLHRLLGERWAADEALRRTGAGVGAERLRVAECALIASWTPAGWWNEHRSGVLEAISQDRSEHPSFGLWATLCGSASKLHEQHQDVEGLLGLASAMAVAMPPLDAHGPFMKAAWSLRETLGFEEALLALASHRDPAARLGHAYLREGNADDDGAIEEMEALIADEPGFWPGWSAAWAFHTGNLNDAEQARLEPRLLETASRLGMVVARRDLHPRTPSMCNCVGESEVTSAAWELAGKMIQGQVIPALQELPPLSPRELTQLGHDVRSACSDKTTELLRHVASIAEIPSQLDAFTRGWCGELRCWEDLPEATRRLRGELEADPSFMALPSAQYMLALLHDRQLDREEIAAREGEAYARGCRSTGLLLDLLALGDDVMAELARIDPVQAQLEAALRTTGTQALVTFLAGDEAWPDQVERARRELLRRQAETRGGQDEPRRGAPRQPGVQPLALVWAARRSPEGATHPSLAGTVLTAIERGDGQAPFLLAVWTRAGDSRDVLDIAKRAFSDGARPEWTDLPPAWQRSFGPTPKPVRTPGFEFSDPESLSEAIAHHTRSAARIHDYLFRYPWTDESWAAFERFLDLRRGAGVEELTWELSCETAGVIGVPLERIAERLLEECRCDEDRLAVFDFAEKKGLEDLSARIDRDLLSSSDGVGWFQAYRRMRDRTMLLIDPEATLALAKGRPAWLAAQLRGYAVFDALDAGRLDLAAELLRSANAAGNDLPWELRSQPRLPEVLLPLLETGQASPALWRLAQIMKDPRISELHPTDRLYEMGFRTREAWKNRVVAGTEGDAVEAIDRFCATLPSGEASWRSGSLASLASELAARGYIDVAVHSIDAWAARCGTLEARTWESRPMPPFPPGIPFDLRSKLHGRPLSAPAHAGLTLAIAGLLPPARERLEQGIREAPSQDDADRLALSLAWVEWKEGLLSNAVGTIRRLSTEASDPDLRREMWRLASSIFARETMTRFCFVEELIVEFEAVPGPPTETVRMWEALLGHEDIRTREEASDRLSCLGLEAVPLLRELYRSADPEVSTRSQMVLEELARP